MSAAKSGCRARSRCNARAAHERCRSGGSRDVAMHRDGAGAAAAATGRSAVMKRRSGLPALLRKQRCHCHAPAWCRSGGSRDRAQRSDETWVGPSGPPTRTHDCSMPIGRAFRPSCNGKRIADERTRHPLPLGGTRRHGKPERRIAFEKGRQIRERTKRVGIEGREHPPGMTRARPASGAGVIGSGSILTRACWKPMICALFCLTCHDHGHQAHLSAQQSQARPRPRFPCPHEDPRWPQGHQRAPRQGPQAPRGLNRGAE